MKTMIAVFIALFLATTAFAQSWTTQISGTTQNLNDVVFINVNTGWAVGSSGNNLTYDQRWSHMVVSDQWYKRTT